MSDKPVAALVTVLVVAPLCAVCILGPAFLGAAIGGGFGWLAELRPLPTLGLATLAAVLAYGLFRLRRRGPGRTGAPSPAGDRHDGN